MHEHRDPRYLARIWIALDAPYHLFGLANSPIEIVDFSVAEGCGARRRWLDLLEQELFDRHAGDPGHAPQGLPGRALWVGFLATF